jgi:hypothetical protein
MYASKCSITERGPQGPHYPQSFTTVSCILNLMTGFLYKSNLLLSYLPEHSISFIETSLDFHTFQGLLYFITKLFTGNHTTG